MLTAVLLQKKKNQCSYIVVTGFWITAANYMYIHVIVSGFWINAANYMYICVIISEFWTIATLI